MDKVIRAYIAGFLDGDGSIMMQLVRRRDYIFGYQIRASIVFYQSQKNRQILDWLKSQLDDGYIRRRNDGMAEYTIVGLESVRKILEQLRPYTRLKRRHIELALMIIRKLADERLTARKFLGISRLVDKFKQLNYSKRRINTSQGLEVYLKNHSLLSP